MEHKYLKIIGFYDEVGLSEDGLSYTIGFKAFEEVTVSLLKYVGEAIILLSCIVHTEETWKHEYNKELIANTSTFKCNDAWKK